MIMRRCGSSALELPVLGIGCWSFGGGEYWGAQDQRDVDNVVSAALETGCTYFDTAEVYNDGRSETSLGIALAGRRHDAIIGTKLSPHNATPEKLRRHCEASLKRLATDHIDLYMLHWALYSRSMPHYTDDPVAIAAPPSTDDALCELGRLRDEGKIRFIGVSNHGVKQLTELESYAVAVDQVCYNLLTRAIESEILPYCRDHGIGVVGYMPLMQGLLTGKYRSVEDIPSQRTRTRHFSGTRPGSRHGEAGHEQLLGDALTRIAEIATEAGIPVMRLALAWSIAAPGMTCTVNGVRDAGQLLENVEATELSLDEAIIEQLNDATRPLMEAIGSSPDLYEARERTRVF